MRTDSLVDRLSQISARFGGGASSGRRCFCLLLAVVEVAAFLGMGFMRPDMPMAMETPSFWWKLASMGLIAVLGAGVALMSADPVRSPRRGLRWILACIAVIFATGWLIDAAGDGAGGTGPSSRLDTRPPVRLEDGGAVDPSSYRPGRADTAWRPDRSLRNGACRGLSSAAWGAFVFVFACPSDDPLYIAVWYTVGCSIVTVLGRADFASAVAMVTSPPI